MLVFFQLINMYSLDANKNFEQKITLCIVRKNGNVSLSHYVWTYHESHSGPHLDAYNYNSYRYSCLPKPFIEK